MDTRILLVPYDSAQRSVRMGAGPERWMQRGLAEQLQETGRNMEIEIIESTRSFHAEIATAFDLHRSLATRVQEAHRQGACPWSYRATAIARSAPARVAIQPILA
jgi:hypothetical protein